MQRIFNKPFVRPAIQSRWSSARLLHNSLRPLAKQLQSTTDHHHHHHQEERHEVLSSFFYKFFGTAWVLVFAFIAQHKYFTRPDEHGDRRLHPITRWLLYYRASEEERQKNFLNLLIEARREGEENVFFTREVMRPVKDPRYDPLVLSQKKWGYAPEAQELDHVDVEGIKWRKGYGEDEDSIEVLESKGLKASDKK